MIYGQRRAFDGLSKTPCPVCLELAKEGVIQPRAVMPLPKFPARLRSDNRQCCRDCQATETTMVLAHNHPDFDAARITVANERVEGLVMPVGMMEHFGLCAAGFIDPCSFDDLETHQDWMESHGIPDASYVFPFGEEE